MLENNINSIIPIAENISALAEQNQDVSVNRSIEVVLEIISEFTKILESKISTAYKYEQIQKAMKSTLSFIGNCIKSIITEITDDQIKHNGDIFERISSFLNKIIITRVANECSSSAIKLMTDLFSLQLKKDNENQKSISLNPFIKTTELFFKMQSFRFDILKGGTIDTIWNIYCENEIEQNILLQTFIEQMSKHAPFYADSKVRKHLLPFLTMINNSTK